MQASSGPEELFINLPELHWVNSQKNQGCGHLPRQRPGIWNNKGSIRETSACSQESATWKKFTINEKKSNSKPFSCVSFLGYCVFKEGIAPNPKHLEKVKSTKPQSNMKPSESFVGLANFYGWVISDFATKMLPQNEIRKENSHGERKSKMPLKTSKTRYLINLLYSLTAWRR